MEYVYELQARFPTDKWGEVLGLLDEHNLGMIVRLAGYDVFPDIQDRPGYKELDFAVTSEEAAKTVTAALQELDFVEGVGFEKEEVPELTPEEAAAARQRLEDKGIMRDGVIVDTLDYGRD